MIKEAIATIAGGKSLGFDEAAGVMAEIMGGEATEAQIAAFITALRLKGETVDEIAGMAHTMRAKAVPVITYAPVLDIVGTGGDNAKIINLSTTAALIAAGAGIKVAKHGNRAITSHSGSADVLEALGVKIDLGANEVAECIERAGIGFMLAPVFHPAMKFAAGPRREIGIRTVFNILGPLTNPARAEYLVIGVAIPELGEKMAAVLKRLGTKHALVIHGSDGLDEISISGTSTIWEVNDSGVLPPYEISPEACGLKKTSLDDIRGGTPEENARHLRRILEGEPGAKRNAVVMNAAAALIAGGKAPDFESGARLAEEIIDSGQALGKLEELIKISRELGQVK